MPTFLEVAGASYPESYRGNEIALLQGKSLLPLLVGESTAGFAERGLGWEAYGMDAFRRGDWKVLRLPEPFGTGSWQLYNLSEDPGEVNDVASEYPELVDELTQLWELYAKENGVIRPNEPVAYARPVSGRKY